MSNPIFYGSETFIASGQLTLTENTLSSQPGSATYQLTWTGTEAGVDAKAGELELAGVAYQRRKAEGRFVVTAVFQTDPTSGAAETPSDLYGFDTEIAQVDIYAHPRAWPWINKDSTPNVAKAEMEKLLADTDDLVQATVITGTYANNGNALFRYRIKGGTHYDLDRPVFFRQREYSVAYAPRRVIENLPKFYTRSTIISTFAIPTAIANQIPSDPSDTAPTGTVWGWRKRADSSQTVARTGKITERIDWVFGAYDSFFFDQV